ncbi:MAG: hypothetical protein R3E31_27665 [Chloroflexota bacterium]
MTTSPGTGDGFGGGIAIENSSAFLEANTIYANQTGRYGGGVSTLGTTNLLMQSNLIYNNNATLGGGGTSLQGNVTLWNNTIADNTAANGGGIMYQAVVSSPSVIPSLLLIPAAPMTASLSMAACLAALITIFLMTIATQL